MKNIISNIKLVDGALEGLVELSVWNDFVGMNSDPDKFIKGFDIEIGGDMYIDNPTIEIEHVNAYNFMISHSENVKKSILLKLLQEYPDLQLKYYYHGSESKKFMPDVKTFEQFKHLIKLNQIHILNVNRESVAYVGYEFSCSWDIEHGIGFMMHKDRIVKFGQSDTSFLTWIAREDLQKE